MDHAGRARSVVCPQLVEIAAETARAICFVSQRCPMSPPPPPSFRRWVDRAQGTGVADQSRIGHLSPRFPPPQDDPRRARPSSEPSRARPGLLVDTLHWARSGGRGESARHPRNAVFAAWRSAPAQASGTRRISTRSSIDGDQPPGGRWARADCRWLRWWTRWGPDTPAAALEERWRFREAFPGPQRARPASRPHQPRMAGPAGLTALRPKRPAMLRKGDHPALFFRTQAS